MGVGAGLYMYDVFVEKFTFAISSRDEFLVFATVKNSYYLWDTGSGSINYIYFISLASHVGLFVNV